MKRSHVDSISENCIYMCDRRHYRTCLFTAEGLGRRQADGIGRKQDVLKTFFIKCLAQSRYHAREKKRDRKRDSLLILVHVNDASRI